MAVPLLGSFSLLPWTKLLLPDEFGDLISVKLEERGIMVDDWIFWWKSVDCLAWGCVASLGN